jgi:hypothetical protein
MMSEREREMMSEREMMPLRELLDDVLERERDLLLSDFSGVPAETLPVLCRVWRTQRPC